jgi:hypothetical protein
MLRYGCTRLEIGVQSVYEDVARDTNRGHTVRAVSESFHLAKDAGFKVVAHMMPDLPNVGVERDLEQFKEYFENPAFRSDGLKIYPTLVIRGTGLYELWRTGRYKNYTPNVLVDVVARILALVPPWTRVYRVQRCVLISPLLESWFLMGRLICVGQRYPASSRIERLREFRKSERIGSEPYERFRCGVSRCAVPRSRCTYLSSFFSPLQPPSNTPTNSNDACRSTKFTTKSAQNPLNSYGETTQPTAAGKPSSPTKTPKTISSSVSCVYENALTRVRSDLNSSRNQVRKVGVAL